MVRTVSAAARSRARTSQWACRGASAASINSTGRLAGRSLGMLPAGERERQPERAGLQFVERLGQDQLALVEQGDMAGHALDLRDLVARKEHRPPRAGQIHHAFEELAANHRVEARGRLVEHQQRRVRRQGQRERDLGFHALRQGLDLPLQWQAEALGQRGVACLKAGGPHLPLGMEARGKPANLGDRHPVVEAGCSGT